MVCSAISCIWNYLLWKANEILMPKNQPASDISLDKMNDLIVRRDQIVQTLFEVGVSISSGALLKVKTAVIYIFIVHLINKLGCILTVFNDHNN